MAVIRPHPGRDWCHCCGRRVPGQADIWRPVKAESAGRNAHRWQIGPEVAYVRICRTCAEQILAACNASERDAAA